MRPPFVLDVEASHGRANAWGSAADGTVVVAARDALVVAGDPRLVIQWHHIDHAAWDTPILTVRHRDPITGQTRRTEVELAQEGGLPAAVRSSVTQSVIVSRRVTLRGEQGAVLAARRSAVGDVSWSVVFDHGLDAADPELQQQARQALSELRQSWGA